MHWESTCGAGIPVGTRQRKKRDMKQQLRNVPSTYRYLQQAQSPVRRDITGSRGGHLFPVLKQWRLPESSETRLSSWTSNKRRRSSKHTVLQTLTVPTLKQGNVTLDLNDFNFSSVRFHEFANEIFPDVLKPQKLTGHHSCFSTFPSLSTPLKTPWQQDRELSSEVQYHQSKVSNPCPDFCYSD